MSEALALVLDLAKRYALGEAQRLAFAGYVKAVRLVRTLSFVAIGVALALQILVLSGFGAVATGVYLTDLDAVVKLKVLFGLCVFLFIAMLGAIALLMSERVWLRLAGARAPTPKD